MNDFYTIAEIGQAHDGSLGILHSFIDALADTGVNAIKFQTHIAEAESSIHEPFRVNFSYEDKTRFDYWERMEFNQEQWNEIGSHCEEVGLDFISSPFSLKAVDLLEESGVKLYKIGSGEVSNLALIRKVCETGKPIFISSGLSDMNELENTVKFIESYGNEVSILQCTTAYPTTPEQWGLKHLEQLKNVFSNKTVGFSDHSGDVFACLSAANWGAEIFEFHITFDHKMFGPDRLASLTIAQVKQLVIGLNQIQSAIKVPLNDRLSKETVVLKNIFGKSLAVNKDLSSGAIITFDDLETKKPGDKGIPAQAFNEVLGKSLKKPLSKWDFLNWEDLN